MNEQKEHLKEEKKLKEAKNQRKGERGKLLEEVGWNLRYAGGRHRQADWERQRDTAETRERERERERVKERCWGLKKKTAVWTEATFKSKVTSNFTSNHNWYLFNDIFLIILHYDNELFTVIREQAASHFHVFYMEHQLAKDSILNQLMEITLANYGNTKHPASQWLWNSTTL